MTAGQPAIGANPPAQGLFPGARRVAGGAELNSAVSRIFNPPALASSDRIVSGNAQPNTIRRYSRLEICATRWSAPVLGRSDAPRPGCLHSNLTSRSLRTLLWPGRPH